MKLSPALVQLVKYGMVGVFNTLLTLLSIFVCKSYFELNPYVSNAIGYVIGLTNSFMWNRMWVFRSHGRYHHEAALFLIGFGICYAIQLCTVWILNAHTPLGPQQWDIYTITISGYGVATLIGNVVYTICNFIYNRMVTFTKR